MPLYASFRDVETGNPPTYPSPSVAIVAPVIMLIIVVLPAPLGPNRAKHEPLLTPKLTPSTASLQSLEHMPPIL